MNKGGYVYIMSNHTRSTLYIGVTSSIERRVLEHKAGVGSAFTTKYTLTNLLYAERLPTIEAAIQREKQLKNWHRDWKFNLIRQDNPALNDLAEKWYTPENMEEVRNNR